MAVVRRPRCRTRRRARPSPRCTWKVPPNAAAGSTPASRRRGRRRSSRLTLIWAPSGVARPVSPSSRASSYGATPESTVVAARCCSTPSFTVVDLAVGGDAGDLGAGDDLRARLERGPPERAADGAHAADRDVPVPGAAADDVVQEAAVRRERLVDRGSEGADERVGQHDAAHEVVREPLGHGVPDRALDELRPEGVVAERLPRLAAGEQGIAHGREHRLGQAGGRLAEAAPGRDVARRADRGERGGGRRRIAGVDEQAGVRARKRRIGGVAPAGEPDVEAEVAPDLLRHEAHQIGVAREPRLDAREDRLGDRGAADPVEPLEQRDAQARPERDTRRRSGRCGPRRR